MSGRGFLIKYVIELKEGVDMRKILIVIDMQNDFIDAAICKMILSMRPLEQRKQLP